MVRKAAAKAEDQAPQLLDSWRRLITKGSLAVERQNDLDYFIAHNRTLIKTLADMSVRVGSAFKLLSAIAAMSEASVKLADLKQQGTKKSCCVL